MVSGPVVTVTELCELLHSVEGGATVLLSSTTNPSSSGGRVYAIFTAQRPGSKTFQRICHDEADLEVVVRRYAKG